MIYGLLIENKEFRDVILDLEKGMKEACDNDGFPENTSFVIGKYLAKYQDLFKRIKEQEEKSKSPTSYYTEVKIDREALK